MKVLLNRDLFIGGSRYRHSVNGTEIPDEVDGKKLVMYTKTPGEDEMTLPQDVTMFDPAKPRGKRAFGSLIRDQEKSAPVALSQLPKTPSAEDLLNKKK